MSFQHCGIPILPVISMKQTITKMILVKDYLINKRIIITISPKQIKMI